MSKTSTKTVETVEPFTFAGGAVRLARLTWKIRTDRVTGVETRRCVAVRELDA